MSFFNDVMFECSATAATSFRDLTGHFYRNPTLGIRKGKQIQYTKGVTANLNLVKCCFLLGLFNLGFPSIFRMETNKVSFKIYWLYLIG